MKRRALGKGLGSLIPSSPAKPLGSTIDSAPPPPMSAADIARASARKPVATQVDAADVTVLESRSEAQVESDPVAGAADSNPPSTPAMGAEQTLSDGDGETVSPRDESAQVSPISVIPGADTSRSGGLQWIDIDRIRPNPLQPRKVFATGQLDELTASIQSSGVLQPIIVRRVEGGYGLVAGERRWRAAQRAGLLKIPALIREFDEEHLLEVALVENVQRADLNPIEEARAYASLVEDFGLSPAEIGERVGKERSTIANSLRLLSLSPKVQALVQSGSLSMGHARALVSLPNHKAQDLGAEVVGKQALSVRQTEAWVRRHTETTTPSPERIVDPNVRAAEESLQRRLGTRVRILQGAGGKGRLVVDYSSSAELDRLYERLIRS